MYESRKFLLQVLSHNSNRFHLPNDRLCHVYHPEPDKHPEFLRYQYSDTILESRLSPRYLKDMPLHHSWTVLLSLPLPVLHHSQSQLLPGNLLPEVYRDNNYSWFHLSSPHSIRKLHHRSPSTLQQAHCHNCNNQKEWNPLHPMQPVRWFHRCNHVLRDFPLYNMWSIRNLHNPWFLCRLHMYHHQLQNPQFHRLRRNYNPVRSYLNMYSPL